MLPFCASLALAGCAVRTPAREDDVVSAADVAIEREDRQLAMPSGGNCVIIDNAFGDIHLRAGIAGNVAHHAVIQRIEPNLPRPQVTVTEIARCLHVVVRIDGERPSSAAPWNVRRARVDLALAIPPGASVDARSEAGSIDARRLDNNIVAHTGAGSILLSGPGDYSAVSGSGAIALTASGARAHRRWHATSDSGDILVHIDAADGALSAQSCGAILHPFVDAVVTNAADGCRSLRIGAESPVSGLEFRSRSGDIEIHRLEP